MQVSIREYIERLETDHESLNESSDSWAFYDNFIHGGGVLQPGQRVRVNHPAGIGYRGGMRYATVERLTATQIALDDGQRYVKATGKQVGARAKSERGKEPMIIRVHVGTTD